MTPEEAAEWNKGTPYEGQTFYHYVQTEAGVERKLQNGLSPSREGARGGAIYLTTSSNPGTANFVMLPERRLKVAVRVKNPFEGRSREIWELEEKINPDGSRNLEEVDILKESGYDSYLIRRTDGSKWLLLFDKEQATIVGSERMEP